MTSITRFVHAHAVCVAAVLTGCGGAPSPVDQLATTQGSIRGAEEAGASGEPDAALHLKLAKEQLGKAKTLMQDEDNEEATRLLQRAESDAELARSLARRHSAEADASEAQAEVDKVKGAGP